MKRKVIAYALVPFIVLSLVAWKLVDLSEARQKEKVIGQSIMMSLNTGHYLKKQLDDEFSETVFEMYLQKMDPTKKFLLQKDVNELGKWKHKLDEQLKATNFEFFNRSVEIISKRTEEAKKYYDDILSEPFDFEKDETIQLDSEKQDFVSSTAELKEEWRKALKYQTMVRLKDMLNKQEKALEREDTSYTEKSFEELEKKAREKVAKRQKDWFENLDQLERKDRFSAFYNAVANAFGPHTGYYPPKDKENFDIQMSGKLEGIGAQLTRRNGYVKVIRIVPGSASWKQGDLKAGDKILKVAQEGEDPVDVVGMRLDNVVQKIRGKKGTVVTLTVEKADGTIMDIPIERDVVVLEETYARSAVLENEKFRAGYIHLPKFYVDFNDSRGRRCSRDVKKELEKMEDENIQGLIIDLRNNGGGSLPDVVKIAGMFIDEGPVVQIKSKYGKPKVLEDEKAGIKYDGPLLIMVNQGSASASEIMAAAMQDYERAIVVGSPSTFGKGTVQRFYDLDRMIQSSKFDKFKPFGSVKITTQKFYRINGGSTQLKGVTPDIVLPDRYAYVDVGEKEMDNAMPWSETNALEYETWDEQYDMSRLKKRSKKRVDTSKVFDRVDQNALQVKNNRENTTKTLNIDKFIKQQEKLQEQSKELKNVLNKETGVGVNQLKENYESFSQDSVKMERFKKWKNGLKEDIYLEEAVNILEDVK